MKATYSVLLILLTSRVTGPSKWLFLCFGWKRAILALLLRQIFFSAASRTCLPYLSWGLPLCFVLWSCMSLYAYVYLWLSHLPSLWVGIQGFCCHCVSLLTNAAICGRPWGLGLYILSFKEVVCTLLCQCQEKSVWFGVIRVGGECRYCFSFSLEEVPQAEPLRDPRRAMSSYKSSPSDFLGMSLP